MLIIGVEPMSLSIGKALPVELNQHAIRTDCLNRCYFSVRRRRPMVAAPANSPRPAAVRRSEASSPVLGKVSG